MSKSEQQAADCNYSDPHFVVAASQSDVIW